MTFTKYAWRGVAMVMVLALSGCAGRASMVPSPSLAPTPSPPPSATPTPMLVAIPSPVTRTTPTPTLTTAECPFGDYKSAIAAEINSIRSRAQVCGGVAYPAVGGLGWNVQLESAADKHSTDMAVNNFFAHPSSDGLRIGARASSAGYAYIRVGENIAAGQSAATQVSADWLASASHCANIMTPSFVDMGASCKYNPSSTYQYYWTLVMGNR